MAFNLTRKVASSDATQIACYKGLVAGSVNTCLAVVLGSHFPSASITLQAMLIGLFGYGISLVLYVLSLRHIGAAGTGAYFALAPFIGVLVSLVILKDPVTLQLVAAASFMGIGLWLHLTEKHAHVHTHEVIEHEHLHSHDEHHQHGHSESDSRNEPHSHKHRHDQLTHTHPHFPDENHLHSH